MNNKIVLWCILLLLLTLSVAAAPYHLKLLAVQESDDKLEGSDADIYLELKEGTGRVFLETTPVIKSDTQISTRFAKDIACKYFKLNCNQYDFLFTIRAQSNIIGGPSASAAIAALTTIAVLDLPYDQQVTVTGTINSGGIVGPVGGMKEKLQAASKSGLQKVLIPLGSTVEPFPLNQSNSTNTTAPLNLIQYAQENLSLEVAEVIDLDELLFQLTTKHLVKPFAPVVENQQYTQIMSSLQQVLCQRTEKIEQEMTRDRVHLDNQTAEALLTKKLQADNATRSQDFYAAASYCFGANIQLKSYYYQQKKVSPELLSKLIDVLEKNNEELKQKLAQQKIETISDLQTLMIVQERTTEVKTEIEKFRSLPLETSAEELSSRVAYAEERYYSALSWMQFFKMDGKKFLMDREQLRNSCIQKISEAQEWSNYVGIYIGNLMLININEKIERAQKMSQQEEYPVCLITASQAKADANAIFSSIGLNDGAIQEFLNSKQKAVERVIAANSAEGIFPILGYSYYQYAQSLQQKDKFTSLVYLEYALEMSDLSIYFPEENLASSVTPSNFFQAPYFLVLEGIVLGVIGTLLVFYIHKSIYRKSKPPRKILI
ncbi:TPA: hypothetical protein HA242_03925 [Candidatus Woesearchaeota archaeon]|nr:hypothetical protein [Candidatus Woesearchaeota archaeon]HIH12845.1 hypothetical protein [Candidatus Woesearchaeota archaeon]